MSTTMDQIHLLDLRCLFRYKCPCHHSGKKHRKYHDHHKYDNEFCLKLHLQLLSENRV